MLPSKARVASESLAGRISRPEIFLSGAFLQFFSAVESTMRSLTRVSIVTALVALASAAFSQGSTAPVASLKIVSPTVVVNKTVQAVITLTFADGLHGYQNPASDPTLIPVSVSISDKAFHLLKVDYPKGRPTKVEGEPKPVSVYEGTIKIPVTLQAPAKPGKITLNLKVEYQQCNAQTCFPPSSLNTTATVNVVKSILPTMQKASKKAKG